jgi:hypothetical protein
LRHQLQEGGLTCEWPARAGDTVGGVGAQAEKRVAVAETSRSDRRAARAQRNGRQGSGPAIPPPSGSFASRAALDSGGMRLPEPERSPSRHAGTVAIEITLPRAVRIAG